MNRSLVQVLLNAGMAGFCFGLMALDMESPVLFIALRQLAYYRKGLVRTALTLSRIRQKCCHFWQQAPAYRAVKASHIQEPDTCLV
jgi:hypothetical protein